MSDPTRILAAHQDAHRALIRVNIAMIKSAALQLNEGSDIGQNADLIHQAVDSLESSLNVLERLGRPSNRPAQP